MEVYRFCETLEEINFLNTLQAGIAVEVAAWLCGKLDDFGVANKRVFDLGCGSGNLTTLVRDLFPDAEVVGIDYCEHFIDLLQGTESSERCRFLTWDYSKEGLPTQDLADALVTSFGIDFKVSDHQCSLEKHEPRDSKTYEEYFDNAATVLRNWRACVKDGGKLFLVLRLPSVESLVAIVDAASDVGWQVRLDASKLLSAGTQAFPALTLDAISSNRPSCDDVASFMLSDQISNYFSGTLNDPLAGTVYHALSDKQELQRKEQSYPDGSKIRTVVGTVGYLGYRYTCTTKGFEALQIVPAMRAHELPADFVWFNDVK